jgi:HSP20 family protein
MEGMATKYNPFDEMTRMFEEMRNAFWEADDGFFDGRTAALPVGTYARTNLDLTEREGEYVLSADLPGFETEEMTVSFDDGLLTIVAEHDEEGETVSRSRAVHEQVTVPAEIDEEAFEAAYRNGVLTVRMPILEGIEESDNVIEIED